MLVGLDQVNWGRFPDGLGTSEHVPDDIRALTSPDPLVRKAAVGRLRGSIFHQGSRYRASAPAVPFLFEVLTAPGTESRSEIIELLALLAVGYPGAHLPFGFDPKKEFKAAERLAKRVDLERLRAADPDEGEECDVGVSTLWERDAYEAVERHVEVFQQLACDEDEAVRRSAVRALAWFPRAATESARVVREAVLKASSSGELANALLCLGILDHYLRDLADVADFLRFLSPPQPDPVRLAAAVSLGVVLQGELPSPALAVLLAAIEVGMDNSETAGVEVWNVAGPAGLSAALLARLRPKPREPLLSALCRAAASDVGDSRAQVWHALLMIVFRRPRPVKWVKDPSHPVGVRGVYLEPANLTANQLRALQAIGRNPIWDRTGSLHDNHMDVCYLFGLPSRVEAYRALVAAAEERRGNFH